MPMVHTSGLTRAYEITGTGGAMLEAEIAAAIAENGRR